MDALDFVPGSAYIACSFAHETDGEILKAVLRQNPSYVGMLGGKPKIENMFRMLKAAGCSEEVLKTIHAPMGLDLGGEDPASIAVAVMAEILMVQNHRTGRPLRESMAERIFPLE